MPTVQNLSLARTFLKGLAADCALTPKRTVIILNSEEKQETNAHIQAVLNELDRLSGVDADFKTAHADKVELAEQVKLLEEKLVWCFDHDEVPFYIQGKAGEHEINSICTAEEVNGLVSKVSELRATLSAEHSQGSISDLKAALLKANCRNDGQEKLIASLREQLAQAQKAPAEPASTRDNQWEYDVVTPDPHFEYKQLLNDLGAMGWELVSVVPANEGSLLPRREFYFKRKILK